MSVLCASPQAGGPLTRRPHPPPTGKGQESSPLPGHTASSHTQNQGQTPRPAASTSHRGLTNPGLPWGLARQPPFSGCRAPPQLCSEVTLDPMTLFHSLDKPSHEPIAPCVFIYFYLVICFLLPLIRTQVPQDGDPLCFVHGFVPKTSDTRPGNRPASVDHVGRPHTPTHTGLCTHMSPGCRDTEGHGPESYHVTQEDREPVGPVAKAAHVLQPCGPSHPVPHTELLVDANRMENPSMMPRVMPHWRKLSRLQAEQNGHQRLAGTCQ